MVTSYHLTVEADNTDAAEKEAASILREHFVGNVGGVSVDSWQDVMGTEEIER